ncbi:MAG: ThiF family adenylyltransferase [Candidatus Aminicenantia bacterium]
MQERYSRQILVTEIGEEGQEKLLKSSILLIGCGGLGSTIAEILVRAGVGRLRIVDRDFVDISNLQRQILFDEEDVYSDIPKVVLAEKKLKRINRDVRIEGIVADFNHTNAETLAKGFDLIIDGLDNMEGRFLINDLSIKTGIPWIYGTSLSTYGMTFNIIPGKTPCLRCIYEHFHRSFLTCETVGIIGSAVVLIASIQSTEAIKILTGKREELRSELLFVDLWKNEFEKISIAHLKKEDCPACGKREFEFLEGKNLSSTVSICGSNSVQINPSAGSDFNLERTIENLKIYGTVVFNEYLAKLFYQNYEITIFRDGRAIIKGTSDPSIAKSLYSKFIGM